MKKTKRDYLPVRKGFEPVRNMYAFWKYSGFPYVLGGPVLSMNNEGLVQVTNYGGAIFRPVYLTTLKNGQALQEKIVELEKARSIAEKEFHDSWRATVSNLFSGLLVNPAVFK
jgi:hypothetical protein